jgi:putative ABC transport system ATP-binding protein
MIDLSHVFELNNIYFAYPDSENVLENINFKVRQNEVLIVKGESGIGKSSFLKLFNRFNDITGGKLLFRGRNLNEYNVEEIRSSIIYLPQLPHLIDGTVEENLIFPFQFHAHSNKRFNKNRAAELFDHFHLKFSINYDARKLSVGQRQRIALIRAILLEPEVLLLDEPGSSLDEFNRRNLENQLALLSESSGITVIMATHGDVNFQNRKHRTFNIRERTLVENIPDKHS